MKKQIIVCLMGIGLTLSLTSGPVNAQVNYALNQPYSPDPALTSTSAWWLGEDPPYTSFTDGFSQWAGWSARGWVGTDNVGSTTIDIDLGSAMTDIISVTVDQMISVSSAVQGSHDIQVSGSLDGVTFTNWGSMFVPYDYTNHPEQTWSCAYNSVAYTNYALNQAYTTDPALTPTSAWWLGEDPPYTSFTDGLSQWAGWSARGWQGPDLIPSVTVVIDLGVAQTDIESVTVDQMVSVSSGVAGATDIQVSGSLDGVSFTDWGSMIVPFDHVNNPEQAWTGTWMGSPMSAQYVMLNINWDPAYVESHKLLQEIAVNGNPVDLLLSAQYVRLNITWDSAGSNKLLQEIAVIGEGSGIEDWRSY
jgi:hypothetical protein